MSASSFFKTLSSTKLHGLSILSESEITENVDDFFKNEVVPIEWSLIVSSPDFENYVDSLIEMKGLHRNQSPVTLLRFLLSRNGDIRAALDQMDKAIKYHEEHQIGLKLIKLQEILGKEDHPITKILIKYFFGPFWVNDCVKPISLVRFSVSDISGVTRAIESVLTEDDIMSPDEVLFLLLLLEIECKISKCHEESVKSTSIVLPKFTQIFDMGDYGMDNWTNRISNAIPLYKKLSSALEFCYPETVEKLVIVKPPKVFKSLYNTVFSCFIDSNTKNKIEMLSSWEKIEKGLLPEHYIHSENKLQLFPMGGIVR